MVSDIKSMPTGIETILLVDDEKPVIDAIKPALEYLGYNVVAKMSGIEALEVFRSQPHKIDIVITDQAMPDMTGERFAKELMALRSDMPVILCSGFNEIINKKKVKAAGIREFITKPVILRDMAKTIRKALTGPTNQDMLKGYTPEAQMVGV